MITDVEEEKVTIRNLGSVTLKYKINGKRNLRIPLIINHETRTSRVQRNRLVGL